MQLLPTMLLLRAGVRHKNSKLLQLCFLFLALARSSFSFTPRAYPPLAAPRSGWKQPNAPKRGPLLQPPSTVGAPRTSVALRAGLEDMRYASWEWMANLGAPSALVGGAALASFFDLRADLEVDPKDRTWVALSKKAISVLLLTAFAMEITCVFVTTVTGTLLQGTTINGLALSSIDLMTRELEFEYLASRICFFQGLLNWLAGIALHQILPDSVLAGKSFADLTAEEKASRRLRVCNGASVASMALFMVAFYNKHIPSAARYSNYFGMVSRLGHLTVARYFTFWKDLRLVPMVALVPIGVAAVNAFKAFFGE